MVVDILRIELSEDTVQDFFRSGLTKFGEMLLLVGLKLVITGLLLAVEEGRVDVAGDEFRVVKFGGAIRVFNGVNQVGNAVALEEAGGFLVFVGLEADGTAGVEDVDGERLV